MSASTDHEAIVIKVWTDRGPIDVINYYNPCGKLSQDILRVVGGGHRLIECYGVGTLIHIIHFGEVMAPMQRAQSLKNL